MGSLQYPRAFSPRKLQSLHVVKSMVMKPVPPAEEKDMIVMRVSVSFVEGNYKIIKNIFFSK